MKRIAFFHILLTALLCVAVSCAKTDSPGSDKDGKMLYFLERLSFNISVDEAVEDTKAVKKSWANGDKINLWFAANYAQTTPDMVLTYNGTIWVKSYVREGSTLPQNGTFGALYESSNTVGSKSATVSGTSSVYQVPASSATGGSFNCSPLLMSVSDLAYSIDSKTEVLTARITGWQYSTRFKVLIKTDAGMSKSADKYALGLSTECHPVSSFGPAKASDADKITFSIEYNSKVRYAGGVQEEDGIAFYFDSFSCSNEKVTFGLIENGGQPKVYTTTSLQTMDAASATKCAGVSLAYSVFTPATDTGMLPEQYGENVDIDIEDEHGPYDIIYHLDDREDSVSLSLANTLADRIKAAKGYRPRVFDADNKTVPLKEIIIGRTSRSQSQTYYNTSPRPSDFSWKINYSGGNIVITAGGSWALEYAVDKFTDDYLSTGFAYTEGKVESGTVEGMNLFPITSGCNLRILDCNVWERDSDTNESAWAAKGESCAISARIPRFKQLIRAYMPDVMTFQEYSNTFDDELAKLIKDYGYSFTYRASNDFTPVIYNKNTVTYLTKKHVVYGETFKASDGTVLSPGIRKSYTIFAFKHKATNKCFTVVSSHWWAAQNAAGNECRVDEATKLKSGIDDFIKSRNYPVFLAGDMNCKASDEPMQVLLDNGYQNVITTATLSRDGSMGWHYCNASDFMREYDYKPSSPWWMGNKHDKNDQGRNCVDQFLLYNNSAGYEVKVFERVHTWFTILMCDHYPNYADIKL